jgi:recombination protein RecA
MAKTGLDNPTGIAEIDAILEKLTKDFGDDMSGEDYGNVTFTTSGSTKFDCAIGRGGIPNARIIEIIGDTGSLKTSLALTFLAQKQAARRAAGITNKRDLILDLEHSLERGFIEGFNVDMSQVIWKRFYTAEEALQFLTTLMTSGSIDYVIFDSVDALQTQVQVKKAAGEDQVGGASKIISKAVRQLAKDVATHEATLIFINQIRLNPGQMFGNPETTPGGKSIGYYSRLRIKLLPRKDGHPDVPGAAVMRARIFKNGFGPPLEEDIELAFRYGKGFDPVYDIESLAKDLGILRHSAGQTKVQWRGDAEAEPLLPDIEKGKEAGQRALRENPRLLERLRHACLRIAKVPEAKQDSEFTDVGNGSTKD